MSDLKPRRAKAMVNCVIRGTAYVTLNRDGTIDVVDEFDEIIDIQDAELNHIQFVISNFD